MDKVTLKIYQNYQRTIDENLSRFFSLFLLLQGLGLILISSYLHLNLLFVLLLTLLINFLPALLAFIKPEASYTIGLIALAQILNAILLMQISAGNFATHIYLFISLLLIAFYRKPALLIFACFISLLTFFNYAFWSIVETIILLFFIHQSKKEIKKIAELQAEILTINHKIDKDVQKRTAELEEFSYVLVHDIRTALNNIIRDKSKNINLEEHLSKIAKFIDCAYSYLQIPQIKYIYRKINPKQILNDFKTKLSKGNAITINLINIPDALKYYEEHFVFVVDALLQNAIKYNSTEALIIDINCEEETDFYRFCIRDNGKGIEPKYHQALMKIFQVLEPRDDQEHTGIGLPMIKKIIEQHSGQFYIESESGKGFAAYFTIPKL